MTEVAVWPSLVQCVGPKYSEVTAIGKVVRKRSRADNAVEDDGVGVGLLRFRIRDRSGDDVDIISKSE